MQSNFFRYHFGLEWEKRKFVRRVHAKRILQTAPHTSDVTIRQQLVVSIPPTLDTAVNSVLTLESCEREKLFKPTASGGNESRRSGRAYRQGIKDMIAGLCKEVTLFCGS